MWEECDIIKITSPRKTTKNWANEILFCGEAIEKSAKGKGKMTEEKTKKIFIVLTQAGTITGRALKKITHEEYNHSSISLEEDLSCMYSFGRRLTYYPFYGGFVREAPNAGTFKRFPETDAVVFSVDVTETQYNDIKEYLEDMYANKRKYHYSWIGLTLVLWKKELKRKHYFYCSEFVRDLLVKFQVVADDFFTKVVKPNDFLNFFGNKIIYVGKLRNYNLLPTSQTVY